MRQFLLDTILYAAIGFVFGVLGAVVERHYRRYYKK